MFVLMDMEWYENKNNRFMNSRLPKPVSQRQILKTHSRIIMLFHKAKQIP